MNQVQRDLRELGEKLWPDGHPLRPQTAHASAARRRPFPASWSSLVGIAIGAVFFAAIAAGSIALATRSHSQAPPTSHQSPSPNSTAVVPWLGTMATSSATPFTIPGVTACTAADLSVSIRTTDPGMIGHGPINTSFWNVTVWDISAKPCYVTGSNEATFLTSDGGTLKTSRNVLPATDIIYLYPTDNRPPSADMGPFNLTSPAGFVPEASGEVGSSGKCTLPAIATILWSPGPGLGFVRVSPGPAGGSGTPCSSGTYSYYAFLTAPTGDPIRAQVQAAIVAPPEAAPGDHVHFTVTLMNDPAPSHCRPGTCPTPFPLFSLEPCPTFHEEIEGVAGSLHTYALNCAAAKPIAAGASETFDMYIDVPANAAMGPVALLWAVDQRSGMPHFEVAHAYMAIVTPSSISRPQQPNVPLYTQSLPQSLSWSGLTSGSLRLAEASCDATPSLQQKIDLRDVSDGIDLSFPEHGGGVFAQRMPDLTVYLHLNSGVGPKGYTGFDAVSGTVTYSADGSSGSMDVWLAPDTPQINQAERDFHLTGEWRCR